MRASPRYWELTLTAPPGACEGLTNFLWETGALGVVEEERPGEPPELRAFFPETAAPAILTERVTAYADGLAALGFGAIGRPRVVALEDGGWAEAWREFFRPVTVGRRFVVAPPWETLDLTAHGGQMSRAGGRIVLVIEPGRAFGTGHHGSTAGCLEAIERACARDVPPRALDLGTGSGILAIALAKLGVERVLAVDEDPDAIAAAIANAERNDVAARIACRIDDAATLDAPPAPLVVANLITAVHLRLAHRYAARVAPGGTLILGGTLDAHAAEVERIVAAQGFTPLGTVSREGWSTHMLVRI